MKSLTIGTLLLATGSATAQVCGISGYDNSGHDPASQPAYTIDSKANTPELCSALCKSDSTCQSFAIGAGSCLLYAVAAENNFTADTSKGYISATRSPYYYYEVSCDVTSTSPPLIHSGPICAVKGYVRGNPGHIVPLDAAYSDNADRLCIANCREKPGCTAYAMINNRALRRNTGCYYYTSLVDNFDAVPVDDPATSYSYYFTELSCLDA